MKLEPESRKQLLRIAVRHSHLHRCDVGGVCSPGSGGLGHGSI